MSEFLRAYILEALYDILIVAIIMILMYLSFYRSFFYFFLRQFDASLLELQASLPSNYQDTDDKYKLLRKKLSNDHAKILYCLEDLGLVCAYEVRLYVLYFFFFYLQEEI